MILFILQLPDDQATLENAGGKGMSLAKLSRAGLPVQGGFHITTEAYRRFVSDNGLQSRILEALGRADTGQPPAAEKREQATEAVLRRLDPLHRKWFLKTLS